MNKNDVGSSNLLETGTLRTEDLYVHKSGSIGTISAQHLSDGALFVFEELDRDSGDMGHDNIFYTESCELKECDRKAYNNAFPPEPEEERVTWEEHFTRHILVDKGLDTEQQVYVEKCPHCGGYGDLGEKYVGPYHKIVSDSNMNKVECLKCGAVGPERKCLLESIAAYNERWTNK